MCLVSRRISGLIDLLGVRSITITRANIFHTISTKNLSLWVRIDNEEKLLWYLPEEKLTVTEVINEIGRAFCKGMLHPLRESGGNG